VKRTSTPRLVVLEDPQSFAAEAYRVLRTNLHYANPDTPLRRFLVTSAGPAEGKTTTVANLAVCLAQAERTVLVVDADLRRPVLHTVFDQPDTPGLSAFLAGDASLDTVVQKTAVTNLWLVASGRVPPNPAELLASRRMREFLESVGTQYDVVLVDSPPVLAVGDACSLASLVDGVLLVVGSGEVPRAALHRARDQVAAVHGRILGVVINRFDARADGYPNRYYDYYERYYGREDGQG
jgi:capsular exopolysaccharide synthesis family protein